jgi:hypothetical protein
MIFINLIAIIMTYLLIPIHLINLIAITLITIVFIGVLLITEITFI